jgi:hypothetical protein
VANDMTNILRRFKRRLLNLNYQRNYYLSKVFPRSVPATSLHYLPQGFTVHTIANTGLRIVDNFCTVEEATYLIQTVREQAGNTRLVENGCAADDSRPTSWHTVVFDRHHQDSRVLPIIARGGMLAGVPADHVEQVYVSRYVDGEFGHGHYVLAGDSPAEHRLCTMLVFLNDLNPEQGGAAYFKDLNIAVQPKLGRAVIWSNMNPDGTKQLDTLHAKPPQRGEGTEKWVIQLSFRPYRVHPIRNPLQPLQTSAGIPISGNDTLLAGTWTPTKPV